MSDGVQYIHARPVTRAKKCQRNVGQGVPPGLNSLNRVYSNSENRQGLFQRRILVESDKKDKEINGSEQRDGSCYQ